ncbi:hypothetical protein BJX63DRAFT_424776 [Aspergillus granulosus]|uniref:Zn(2)-C6 fungal-type domain-containing protein n=1 Tax=Aspergillus granulosus TaxID=176169 RepID=A0ABR4GZX9_9EURO
MDHHVRRRQQRSKVANACEACKARKTKCTGKRPCEPCQARGAECYFRQPDKKILVSESYLRKLQHEAHTISRRQTTGSSPASPEIQPPLPVRDVNSSGEEHITNPLVSRTSFYLRDPSGRFRFCGPSSTWSFSQRIFLLLKSELPDFPAPDLPFHVDGSTWQLNWNRTTLDSPSLLHGLPSLDSALYLLDVIKFHSYQTLFLFDEDEFLPQLREFYERGIDKAQDAPLWFIQYLLLIAFAKVLLAAPPSPETPPGAAFFERAMSLMPDFVQLNRQPNLGMQVLYLAGLYLLSVDMKDAAYAYVGQSIRMCIIEGLHRDPPNNFFGIQFANQCRNIWWTAYTLDRQISVMIGAPSSIQDAEVTCSLPVSYNQSERSRFLTMHVRLSRILGDISNSVYTTDARQTGSFISAVRAVLETMANILRDIEEICTGTCHPSIRTVSTMSSHLYLRYHQCIILATRPLFLYLVSKRLKYVLRQCPAHDVLIPSQLRPLLETSLQSAKISVRILSLLYEESLLDSFLPFDLDNIISSAFLLVLAAFIDPDLLPDSSSYITVVTQMLNYIVSRGNLTAGLRTKELNLLQQMTHLIARGDETRERVETGEGNGTGAGTADSGPGGGSVPHAENSLWAAGIEDVSMSYTQILNLTRQLDTVTGSAWGTNFEEEYNNLWI